MLARYVRAVQYSSLYHLIIRLARLSTSRDFRTRHRYYNNKMRLGTDAWLRLATTGERNPDYDLPGADHQTVSRYTPEATARYHLELALGDAGLTLEFLDYCIANGYTQGRREAGALLEQEMKTLSQCIATAKALDIPLEPYAVEHPWAELNFVL